MAGNDVTSFLSFKRIHPFYSIYKVESKSDERPIVVVEC